MKRLLITPALLALTLFACNQAEQPKADAPESVNLAAVKDSIEAANKRFSAAVAASDSVGVAALYASDAKLMAPNMPAFSGTGGITNFASEAFKMGIKNIKFDIANVWGSKDLVVEEGAYTISDDKGAVMDKGKYLVFWKQEDGKWKLFRDIFNSDMPPAPAQPSDRRR